jgi:predicted TIM-barrel fold metal-dependent hydrolase
MSRDPIEPLHPPARPDWLALHSEPALDPGLPITDAHHHVWGPPWTRYDGAELAADIDASGHNVVATVVVQGGSLYRTVGPQELRSLGETEHVAGLARNAVETGGPRLCERIVGHVDLLQGGRVRGIAEEHLALAGDRFVGIRHVVAADEDPMVRTTRVPPPQGLLADTRFRSGFAALAPLELSFDAWLYHPQIPELTELARAFPDTRIILDHLGGPIGVGTYAERRTDVFKTWRRSLVELARCENVLVKLGGLAMRFNGFGFHERAIPPSSDDLAVAFRPFIETAIEIFGPERAMFESNFPVDKGSCSYQALWNAFKKIASDCSADEKRSLFHDTSARAYRMSAAPNLS